jgi:hypothetical protein
MADRLTRRTFMTAAGVAGAALLVGGPGVLAGTRINPYARWTYAPLVGQTLQLSTASGSRQVVLAEVGDLQSPAAAGDAHRFSLLFRSPKGDRLEAGTYSFRHRTFGTVNLFASPVDSGAKADLYQVIVNNPS